MRGRNMGMLSVAWSSATMIGLAAGVALFRVDPNLGWVGMFGIGVAAAAAIMPGRVVARDIEGREASPRPPAEETAL